MGLEARSRLQCLRSFKNNPDLSFRFRLARDLGMTVGHLMTTMSNKEYNQWATYYLWENTEKNKAMAMANAESKKRKR